MTRISDLEDESTYRNNLGRENRSAMKRSILMLLMVIGVIAAAVLLAPSAKPMSSGLDTTGGSTSVAAPAAAPEPTGPVDATDLPRSILLPREKIAVSLH